MNSRTGVFFFSDNEGKADRYLEHILRDIRGELGYLLAVIGCRADDEAMALISRYADDIVMTEKKGLSAPAGYGEGIRYLTEKGLIKNFDELLLFSDTFFGPFIPFRQIFERADREENRKDIQSLSGYRSLGKDSDGRLILDTYFLLIRKNVLSSCSVAEILTRAETIDGGKGVPESFAGKNFSYGAVYDTYSFDQIENTVHNPLVLLKNGFPVIRREAFTDPYSETVSNTVSSYINECFGFIRENYGYDTELIYENIIRCGDPYELLSRLDLNFVLPKNFSLSNLSGDIFSSAVIVFHMYYEQLFDESLSYLDNVPHGTDVIITTTSEDKAALINERIGNYPYLREHSKVLVSIGNGRDMAGLLVEAGQYLSGYKYICFTHDKMSLHHKRTSGQSFARTILENVICSREYIANVISVFGRNDRLGLLVPPPPEHEAYFAVIGRKWTGNFSYFIKLCEKLGMPVNCTKDSVPFALGTSFWCRYDALKNLFEYPWTHSDFPDEPLPLDGSISHAIERCFPFVAKHNGYLSGIICTTDFAQTLLNNREYMLTDLMRTLNEYIGTEKQTLSSLRKKTGGYFLDFNKPDVLKKRLRSIKSNSRVIKRSKFFDKNWYLSAYPDVKDSGLRPEEHYLLKGWRDGYDPSEKFSTSEYLRLNGDVADKKLNPLLHYETYGCAENRKYKLDTGDYRENRLRHSIKRRLGRMLYKKQIARNADKRILVILHMFYMCSWVEIKEYLKNLDVYNYDLIVTYTNVTYNEKVIQGIKDFKPGVKLVECPNVGYDVGPFLFALKDVRLDDYDIVFKLQSKGVNRARCFIYGQYFKKRDWFLNLFEGCIGEFTVHKTIDALGGIMTSV